MSYKSDLKRESISLPFSKPYNVVIVLNVCVCVHFVLTHLSNCMPARGCKGIVGGERRYVIFSRGVFRFEVLSNFDFELTCLTIFTCCEERKTSWNIILSLSKIYFIAPTQLKMPKRKKVKFFVWCPNFRASG